MAEPAVDALRRHAVERSECKRRAAVDAIRQIQDQGEPVSVSAVARAAGVSREFIHSHPDLHQAVRAASRHARAATRTAQAAESGAGLRAERSTLLAQIDKHRATIKSLRAQVEGLEDQRRRWLGSQLADLTVDPEAHVALRRDDDRLASQNRAMQQELDAARRTSAQLDRELAASRRAHAEHVAELAADRRVSAFAARSVFLDPRALLLLQSPWGEQCRDMVHTFFAEVLRAIAAWRHRPGASAHVAAA